MSVTLGEANESIDPHDGALVLSNDLIFCELGLDTLTKSFPIE